MYLQIKNLRIHYRVLGDGEPLLFLHGWGANVAHYSSLLDYLAKQFTVIALDLPGFGLSTAPDAIWGNAEYANFVAEFMHKAEFAFKPITIFGHSLGGKIAVFLAAKKMLPISKLILMSSAGIRAKRSFKMRCKVYAYKFFKRLAMLPVLRIFLLKYLRRYQNKVGSNDYRASSGVMRKSLVKLVNEDWRDILPRVTCETLLIWGDKDQSTSLESGKLMAALLPHAELKVVAGAGHFPFIDDFKATRKILEAFAKESVAPKTQCCRLLLDR